MPVAPTRPGQFPSKGWLYSFSRAEEVVNERKLEEDQRWVLHTTTWSRTLHDLRYGLTLTSIGLYGLFSYQVARRTREIGIRMAVGAEPGEVRGAILRDTLTVVALGLGIGVPVAVVATRALAAILYRVHPYDFSTLAGAILVTLAVAAIAGYLPARRASLVDPMVALREE